LPPKAFCFWAVCVSVCERNISETAVGFHQDTAGDRDELRRFWGQRSKPWQNQIWSSSCENIEGREFKHHDHRQPFWWKQTGK